MKRLLLIGVAVCAFAAMPTLSASAMPRATADTLVSDPETRSFLLVGATDMGTATWVAVITMVGAGVTITGGDSHRPDNFSGAASVGGFLVHLPRLPGTFIVAADRPQGFTFIGVRNDKIRSSNRRRRGYL